MAYALIDAGDGRRLERFGPRVVDRPFAGATEPVRDPAAWTTPDLQFDRLRGWNGAGLAPWTDDVDGLTLELRPTEAGQVGVFPEHVRLWPWLVDRLAEQPGAAVLNLFAHTGATTLALARAGARVAHVDASKPAVAWARRNAALSGLDDRPVRWLVDDAAGFVEREVRRGRRYGGFVVDPPAWGHGATRAWRLDDDLDRLLAGCARLADEGAFLVLTAHSIGWQEDRLGDAATTAFDGRVETGGLDVEASSGATLRLGAFARVIIGR